jgi:hypothetical protein
VAVTAALATVEVAPDRSLFAPLRRIFVDFLMNLFMSAIF